MNESRFVVNASPLIFLAAIDALALLPQLVDQVLIPETVLGEVLAKAEPRISLQILSSPAWVRSSRTFRSQTRWRAGIWAPARRRSWHSVGHAAV